MRELIQPALKIMVRTGLFLSVVAWVVGQWWGIGVTIDTPTGAAYGIICEHGCALGHFNTRMGWDVTVGPHSEFGDRRSFFYPDGVLTHRWTLAGIALLENTGPAISMEHAFIIGTGVLFCAALHFIYRRRPESQPCEV